MTSNYELRAERLVYAEVLAEALTRRRLVQSPVG